MRVLKLSSKMTPMTIVTIQDVLDGNFVNSSVTIRGWIHRKRESKRTLFLVIRDSSNVIQGTVKKSSAAWNNAKNITIESSVIINGNIKQDKRAPGGFEIAIDKLSIVGLAETFPITEYKSEEFLRNIRHLWLRGRRMNFIMKVRSEVLQLINSFFRDESFFEVSPPMFISCACEGGSTLFALKYFNKELYLTQSAQLYLEALIYSLEKVYCIAPSFRAEKSRTIRHVSEYWHIEAEWAFAEMDE